MRFLIYIIVFAFLGIMASTFVSPGLISWYFEPPVDVGVNCRPAVDWGIQKYQLAQLAGLVGGIVLGTIAFFAIDKGSRRQKPL